MKPALDSLLHRSLHRRSHAALARDLQTNSAQPSNERPFKQQPVLKRIARVFTALFVTQTLLSAAPAYAQLKAAPGATAAERPIVDAARNGVDLVHIAPPLRNGISRNQYEQFNVGARGLILNNSAADVNSVLGGRIGGNPQLGYAPARVIVNEVVSAQPSALLGTIEIAGARADLVLANPNGITCDGCGFLNTARATLATGAAQYNADGSLRGFAIERGTIGIGTGGLDARALEQLDLLARSVVVDGEVWAQRLNAVAGNAWVPYADVAAAQPGTGGGIAPQFAIDVRALGGMYANQLYLVATERGVGVNSSGRLAALDGALTLSADGDLRVNHAYGRQGVALRSAQGQVLTEGDVISGARLDVAAARSLTNTGNLQADEQMTLDAPVLDNRGLILQRAANQSLELRPAERLSNSGRIYSAGDLGIATKSVVDASGSTSSSTPGLIAAQGSLNVQADTIDLGAQTLAANGDLQLDARELSLRDATLQAGRQIRADAQGTLELSRSTLAADQGVQARAARLALNATQIESLAAIDLAATQALDASAATLRSATSIALAGTQVSTRGANVTAEHISVASTGIDNGGDISIDSGIDNTAGTLHATRTLSLNAGGAALINDGGTLAAPALSVERTARLSNRAGTLLSGADLAVNAAIDNRAGTLASAGALTLDAAGREIDNRQGTLSAGGALTLSAATLASGDGRIVAAERLRIDAARLAADHAGLGAGKDLQLAIGGDAALAGAMLTAGGHIALAAQAINAASSTATAGGDLGVDAQSLNVTGSTWSAAGSTRLAMQRALDAGGATLLAGGTLAIDAQGIGADAATLIAERLQLDAGAGTFSHRGGQSLARGSQGQTLALHAAAIDNRDGNIAAAGAARIDAGEGTLDSRAGTLSARGDLNLSGRKLDLQSAQLSSEQQLTLRAGTVNAQDALLAAGSKLSLQAENVDLSAARVLGNAQIDVAVNDALNAAQSQWRSDGALAIAAGRIDATGATLSSNRALQLRAGTALELAQAQLAVQGGQSEGVLLQAAQIGARALLALSDGHLTAQASGALDLADAQLQSRGEQQLTAGAALDLQRAQALSASTLSVSAASVAAADARFSAQQGLVMQARDGALVIDRATALAGTALALSAQAGIDAAAATLAAVGNVQLATASGDLRAAGARLQSESGSIALAAAAGTVGLQSASVVAGQSIALHSQGAASTQGAEVLSGTAIELRAASLDNRGGRLDAGTRLGLTLSDGVLDNRAGTLSGQGALALGNAALAQIDNRQGLIQTQGALDLNAARLDNSGGRIVALQGLALRAASAGGGIDSSDGLLATQGDLRIDAGSAALNAERATLISQNGSIDASAAALNAAASQWQARNDLRLNASAGAIDAQGAQLLAGRQATLNATQGVQTANGALAAQALSVDAGQGALNNAGGLLSATGSDAVVLTLRSQGLDNRGGRIESAGNAQLNAGAQAIDNRQGVAVAAGALSVASQGLDNRAGTLAANAALALNTRQAGANANSAKLDNRGGTLRSVQGALTVAAGDLLNGGGATPGTATPGTATSGTATPGTDAGVLAAATDLSINASGRIDNRASSISAGGRLALGAAGELDNRGGALLAAGALDASAAALNNASGRIAANDAVALRSRGAIDNSAGVIESGAQLTINAAGALNSDAGRLLAGDALQLQAGVTSFQRGHLSALGDATLSVSSLDGSGSQLISGGALRIDATGAAATPPLQRASLRSFAIPVALTSAIVVVPPTGGALRLDDATVASDGAQTLNAQRIDAARAVLQAGGDLRLHATDALQIVAAQLLAGGSVALDAATIGAQQLLLMAAGDATLAATGSLDVGAAQLATGGDLRLAGGNIAARDLQLQAGRDLTLNASGRLDLSTTATPLAPWTLGRDATISADGIDLSGRTLLARNLTLDARSGALLTQAAQLSAAAVLQAHAQGIANAGGTLAANGRVTLDAGGGALDNQNGTVASVADALGVTAGAIDNRHGLLASAGALSLNVSTGELRNAAGAIESQAELSVNAARIASQGGRIVARDALRLNATGALDASGGATLGSQNAAVQVTAASIDNSGSLLQAGTDALLSATRITNADGGTLSAAGELQLTLQGGALDNRGGLASAERLLINGNGSVLNSGGVLSGTQRVSLAAGAVDNSAGVIEAGAGGIAIDTRGQALTNRDSGSLRGIVSAGDLRIDSGALDNGGGYIGANGTLNLSASGAVDNRAGTLLALGGARIGSAATLDNRGGSIGSGADLALAAATLLNGQGSVYALRNLGVDAARIDNAGTLEPNFSRGLLAGGDLTVHAGQIDNQGGALVALGNALISASTRLDNRGGRVAGNDVTLDSAELINSGGRVDARQRLNLDAQRFSADGAIVGQGAVTLSTEGDYTNTGRVATQGDLAIRTSGHYVNQGQISSAQQLDLRAASLDNQAGASIVAAGTTLNLSGALNNAGLINASSGATRISAAQLNNQASGRIYGDSVDISAATIGNAEGAVIATRAGDLSLSGAVSNATDALLLSLSDLRIDGTLHNLGGTVNAWGDLRVSGRLENLNAGLSIGQTTATTSIDKLSYALENAPDLRYQPDELRISSNRRKSLVFPSTLYPFDKYGWNRFDSGTLGSADSDVGMWYRSDDPVWAIFGIAAPDPEAPGPEQVTQQLKLQALVDPFHLDLAQRTYSGSYWVYTSTQQTTVTDQVLASQPGQIIAGGSISTGGGVNRDSLIVANGQFSADAGVDQQSTQGRSVTSENQTATLAYLYRGWNHDSRRYEAPIALPDITHASSFALDILPRQAPGNQSAPSNVQPAAGAAIQGFEAKSNLGELRTTAGGGATTTDATALTTAGPGRAIAAPTAGSVSVPTPATPEAASAIAGPSAEAVAVSAGPTMTIGRVSVGDRAEGPLRGSVIAADVRAGQAQDIAAVKQQLSTDAARRPLAVIALQSAGQAPALPRLPTKADGYTTAFYSGQLKAPAAALFSLHAAPDARYLVETDAAFIGSQSFISSDYYLSRLGLNGLQQHKRYGDGFAEARLVDDQVLALTGRRFISGYADSQTQFMALMDAGVVVAQAFQLSPGVGLSAAQMQQLTTDVLLLVSQAVTLPDGSRTQALVPLVYLRRPVSGDITPQGSLIAAADITIRAPGQDVANAGTLYAHGGSDRNAGTIDIQAANLKLSGALAGQQIRVDAEQDIVDIGGQLLGLGNGSTPSLIALQAGRNIELRTAAQTIQQLAGASSATAQLATRVATLSADSISLQAAQDLIAQGAMLTATQALSLNAGRNVELAALTESRAVDRQPGKAGYQGRQNLWQQSSSSALGTTVDGGSVNISAGNALSLSAGHITANTGDATLQAQQIDVQALLNDSRLNVQRAGGKFYQHTDSQQQSVAESRIQASGNVSLKAAEAIRIAGSSVDASQGGITLNAGTDVSIDAVALQQSRLLESASKSSGFLSRSTRQSSSSSETLTQHGSSVGGATVTIDAGRDAAITASSVIADKALSIHAGQDLVIAAGRDSNAQQSASAQRKSGLFGSGDFGVTLGQQKSSQQIDQHGTRAAAATVGSIGGNVELQAGASYRQTGSDVTAPGGDIKISAREVQITEARETDALSREQRFSQSGLSAAVSSPIISVGQTVVKMAEAAGNTRDARMQALAGAAAGLKVYNNLDDMQGAAAALANGDPRGGGSISISLGGSKSESRTQQQSDRARGSSIAAGGDIGITATGNAGNPSTLTIRGSEVSAGGNASLQSAGGIQLEAATNTASLQGSNKSSSGSISLGLSYGEKGVGYGITAAASASRGNEAGDDLSHSATHINAAKALTVQSAGDTRLSGAALSGQSIKAEVGGDLSVQSLQDTSTYTSRQQSVGGSVTYGYGSNSGVSFNANRSRVDSRYQSVAEQAGLKAQDGGFDVKVAGDTTLTGAVIASTEAALTQGLNRFSTGGQFNSSDLNNSARYDASAVGINLSGGQQIGQYGATGAAAGIGHDSGRATGISKSGISGLAADQTKRSDQAATGIAKIFDSAQVKSEINAQVAITQEFGAQATTAIGNYADKQMKEAAAERALAEKPETDEATRNELLQRAKAIEEQWGAQGTSRLLAHTVVGGLTGGAAGAAGAAAGTISAPVVAEALDNAGISGTLKNTLTTLASTAAGAAVGGTAGGAAAVNEVVNNYLSHSQAEQLAAKLKRCGSDSTCRDGAFKEAYAQSVANDKALLNCKSTGNCDALQAEFVDGYKAIQALVDTGLSAQDAGQIFNMENTAQALLRGQMPAKQCATQTCKDHADFLVGVGKGLSKVTPIGLVVGAGMGGYELTQAILNAGLVDTSIAVVRGIAGLPQAIYDGLNSPDPKVRGEAFADALGMTSVAGVVAVRFGPAVAATAERMTAATLDRFATDALLKSGGAIDMATGQSLLDMRQLTTAQKMAAGELFGENVVKRIVPEGTKIGRTPGVGHTGIDDLYSVKRSDVDYVIIEYKFDRSSLGTTLDGKQMSDAWLRGDNTGYDRILESVSSKATARAVTEALQDGRVEKWVVRTRPDGATEIQVLDAVGKAKLIDTSKIIPVIGSSFEGKP